MEDRWDIVATASGSTAVFVEVTLDPGLLDTEQDSPSIGLASFVEENMVPSLEFIVANGWVLKEHAMLGPVRWEGLPDFGDIGATFSAAGVFVDDKGGAAFYRRNDEGTWECTGLLDNAIAKDAPRCIMARRAAGAVIPEVQMRFQGNTAGQQALQSLCTNICSPNVFAQKAEKRQIQLMPHVEAPVAPKSKSQVHWKGTAATPWYKSCIRNRDLEMMSRMLQSGAAMSARDARLNNGLHLCVRRDWVQGLQSLLDARMDVQAANLYQRTPLLEAARLGKVHVVRALAASRADVNYQGGRCWQQHACALVEVRERMTALHCAAGAGGSAEMVKILLAAGATLNVVNAAGATPLALAAIEPLVEPEVVALLLDAKADPDAKNGLGTGRDAAALHMAAQRGDVALTKTLIAARADLNLRFEFGGNLTPLHTVARGRDSSHVEVAVALLNARADLTLRVGSPGKTASDLVLSNGASSAMCKAFGIEASHAGGYGNVAETCSSLDGGQSTSSEPTPIERRGAEQPTAFERLSAEERAALFID